MEKYTLEDIGFESNQLFMISSIDKEAFTVLIDNKTVHLNAIVEIETLESYGDDPYEKNNFKYDKLLILSILPIWDEISQEIKKGCANCGSMDAKDLQIADLEGYIGFGAYIRFMDIDSSNINDSFIPQGRYVSIFIRENEDIEQLIKDVILPRMDSIISELDYFLSEQSRLCGDTNYDEISKFL